MIEYALRNEAEYTAVLMVGADKPDLLRLNLGALCGALVLNLPERDEKEPESRVAAALRWFGDHHGWLLIFDNVDTREAADAVEELLPHLRSGHVVFTSRLSDWSGSVELLELDFLGENAAVEFLLERTKNRRVADESDVERARELAQELDGLAMALEHSGAFISQMRCSLSDYLARWRAHEKKLRAWHDARLMNYALSLDVTLEISFEQLDGAARDLLNSLSWLAHAPIPRALIAGVIPQGRRQNVDEDTPPEAPDQESALSMLSTFSIIKWDTGNETFRIHPLMREAILDRLPPERRAEILSCMLLTVSNYLPDPRPDDVGSWLLWETMAVHVWELVAVEALDLDSDDIHQIDHENTSRLARLLGIFAAEKGLSEAQWLADVAQAFDDYPRPGSIAHED
jgi:hypothetical protein